MDAPAYTHPSIDLQAWEAAHTDPAVLIADGHDIRIAVRNGQLQVKDGPPGQPRIRTIAKQPRTYTRLLVLAGHGMLSVEAIRWLSWAGLPWSVIDTSEHKIVATSGPARTDSRLVRSQALAADTPAGLEVNRSLILAKLDGQARVLADLLPDDYAVKFIRDRMADVSAAEKPSEILAAEGQAANAYFSVWAGRVAVPWSPADLVKVPAHWHGFRQRTSLAAVDNQRSGQPNRHATCPVNALVNFAYWIAEIECVHACHAAGLHPALGFSHGDKFGRDSLALDLLEVIRPNCDRLVLSILAPDGLIPYDNGKPAYFDRRWVAEQRDGTLRLVPPVTHRIASHAAQLVAAVLPHALRVAELLVAETKGSRRPPAKLSNRRRLDGQAPAHRGYPSHNLRAGVTVPDIIPDALWEQIEPMLPPRTTKRGRPAVYSRHEMIAALVARYILGVPYRDVPCGIHQETLRVRFSELERCGAWEKISRVLNEAGHLPALTA